MMAVYAADRQSPRNYRNENTGQREIHALIGVREPSHWASRETTQALQELLYWVSEDEWTFQFFKREGGPSLAESEHYLFRLPPQSPSTVALFSGGLDSLAGLASRAQSELPGSVVLVSGYTNERLAYQQRLLVKLVRARLFRDRQDGDSPEIRHVAVPFGLTKPEHTQEEKLSEHEPWSSWLSEQLLLFRLVPTLCRSMRTGSEP